MPAKKTTAAKKRTAASKSKAAPAASAYQKHMARELAALKAKYNYKTGAPNNKKSWAEIFKMATASWKK